MSCSSIHREYFAAGADIATTNTFTATSIGQADYGLEEHVYEMNLAGARLARQAADEVGGFVAGSIGPLNVTLSLSPASRTPPTAPSTFDQVRDAYAEQIAALAEGGVDLLMIETIFDTLNAKAAIAAALDVAPRDPALALVHGDRRSGRNLSGQTVEAFWIVGRARRAADRRRQLLARRRADAALRREPVPRRRRPTSRATRTPGCRTSSVCHDEQPADTSR